MGQHFDIVYHVNKRTAQQHQTPVNKNSNTRGWRIERGKLCASLGHVRAYSTASPATTGSRLIHSLVTSYPIGWLHCIHGDGANRTCHTAESMHKSHRDRLFYDKREVCVCIRDICIWERLFFQCDENHSKQSKQGEPCANT